MVVNNPLIRPYFLGGGGLGGVPLDSHDTNPSYKAWNPEAMMGTPSCGEFFSCGEEKWGGRAQQKLREKNFGVAGDIGII